MACIEMPLEKYAHCKSWLTLWHIASLCVSRVTSTPLSYICVADIAAHRVCLSVCAREHVCVCVCVLTPLWCICVADIAAHAQEQSDWASLYPAWSMTQHTDCNRLQHTYSPACWVLLEVTGLLSAAPRPAAWVRKRRCCVEYRGLLRELEEYVDTPMNMWDNRSSRAPRNTHKNMRGYFENMSLLQHFRFCAHSVNCRLLESFPRKMCAF